MRIELIMDEAQQAFFDKLKKGNDELVVALDKWNTYIHNHLPIKPEEMLEFMIVDTYVITERSAWIALVHSLKYLHYDLNRLTKQQGGFWYAVILEPKKKMSDPDMFTAGIRQPGSFRS